MCSFPSIKNTRLTLATRRWGFPDWIDPAEALSSIAAQGKAGVLHANETSYHNMCRFNSGFFFDHPLLQRYKWYWRVEPNVRFSCRITYDPFVAMAAHKKQYGYITALWELDDTGKSYRPANSWPRSNMM